jgi:outer membrane protein assembly factor BamD (BamD/ComL family)/TM2 domain-containing membrane protein YozV
MNSRAVSLLIIAILLFHFSCIQASAEATEADRLFGFADSLFEEEDYFRAIGEYKRFIFLYPTEEATLSGKASFRIVESYFKAKRLPEAIAACNQFTAKFPQSSLLFEVLYLKGQAEKQNKQYDEALSTFDIIIDAKKLNYSDRAMYQKALVSLDMGNWQGAREIFQHMPEDSPLFSAASSFAAGLAQKEQLPKKSPGMAGALAAVLPGAGHLYTERPQDAIAAFLLNGAFILGAVELFRHDDYVAGGIFTFFELGWYGGNIYSAVSSAHKYNKDKEEEFLRNLKNRFSVSFYHDRDNSGLLLSKRF